MTSLQLSFACGRYDRTQPVQSGEIVPEGIDLASLMMPPGETFWRLTQNHEFDVSEMSLSGLIMRVARGDTSYLAIPVFTSRVFRHSGILLRDEVSDAKDLVGRRVAVPEYHMTAAMFMRGLLLDEFGVDARDVDWVQAGQFTPGRIEREPLTLPGEIHLEVDTEHTIEELLARGQVAATLNPYGSSLLDKPDGGLRRLYPDPLPAELEYYQRTGVYPIMHTIVVRRDIVDRHPWVPRNLFNAFARGKELALERMQGIGGHPPLMLPFMLHHLDQAREVFGQDIWPYGLAANTVTLETACRYSLEQGLSPRGVRPEELLYPSTVEREFFD